jgi:hypothetical protein
MRASLLASAIAARPGAEVEALAETDAVADRRHHCARDGERGRATKDIVHAAMRAFRCGGARDGQRTNEKGVTCPRATQTLRLTLTLQDIGALVVNLLADVPGSMRDFKPPAKMHSKAVGELHAVLEMP